MAIHEKESTDKKIRHRGEDTSGKIRRCEIFKEIEVLLSPSNFSL